MVKAFFAVLHYGPATATKLCVDSLLKLKGIEKCHILIFDNHSANGSIEELQHRYKNASIVSFYLNDTNAGFSKAMNTAYALAADEKASFFLALNNDIEIKQFDFILKLEEVYKKHPSYIIGPDIYCPRTKVHQSPMYRSVLSLEQVDELIRGREHELKHLDEALALYEHSARMQKLRRFVPAAVLEARNKRKGVKDISLYRNSFLSGTVLQGSCVIASPEYLSHEQVLFEPDTGFYGEELLLALKCRTKGYPTLYTNELKVLHWHGISSGFQDVPSAEALKTKNERLIHAYKIYRDCLRNDPWIKRGK